MSKSKKLDFKPNEFVVYPAHGVGQIVSIEAQEVAGISLEDAQRQCQGQTCDGVASGAGIRA